VTVTRVPFLDLVPIHEQARVGLFEAINRVVTRSQFILGPELESFEEQWADYCGVAHSVGVGNGLDALHLILRALDLGPLDEVIVPANTFVATWLAVTMCGARPVSVEPNPATFNLDPDFVEAAITHRTKAIIAVHLYGHPADLERLALIAKKWNLALIEDAAQAHGARYKGQRIGGHTTAAAWSFYPGKNLGALGDAGAVTTNDAQLAHKVRALRNYGSRAKNDHSVLGVNSRLDEIQAAALSAKLPFLDEWNSTRDATAETYRMALNEMLSLGGQGARPELLSVPVAASWASHVWHLFVIRVSRRPEVISFFSKKGIETAVHYPVRPAQQDAFLREPGSRSTRSNLDDSGELLSLPIGPHLNPEQVAHVIAASRELFLGAV